MKKYYIVNFNEQPNPIDTAEFLGEYEDMGYAKDDAFAKMDDEDMLVGFDSNIEPEYTDDFGFNRVKLELADDEEKVFLRRTDESIEDIPAGLWYWSDELFFSDPTYYTRDGKKWEGEDVVEFNQLLLSDYVEQNRDIASEVVICVCDSSERDFFDNPREIYYGPLAELPADLYAAKVIEKSQIVASSIPEKEGVWSLVIENIPEKEKTAHTFHNKNREEYER